MIAADREHAPPAQQVEVAFAVLVEQVLTASGTEADVEADGLEHAHHLPVEMARMQRGALRFPLGEQRRGVQGHASLPPRPATHRCRPTRVRAWAGGPRKPPLRTSKMH